MKNFSPVLLSALCAITVLTGCGRDQDDRTNVSVAPVTDGRDVQLPGEYGHEARLNGQMRAAGARAANEARARHGLAPLALDMNLTIQAQQRALEFSRNGNGFPTNQGQPGGFPGNNDYYDDQNQGNWGNNNLGQNQFLNGHQVGEYNNTPRAPRGPKGPVIQPPQAPQNLPREGYARGFRPRGPNGDVYQAAQQAVMYWLNSQHRQNLLNPAARSHGIGFVDGIFVQLVR